ncbi:MAG TPA: hypothetical protein VF868_07485 [Bacteroidia bacterium]
MKTVVRQLFGDGYFVVKSIYFDKPEASNAELPSEIQWAEKLEEGTPKTGLLPFGLSASQEEL